MIVDNTSSELEDCASEAKLLCEFLQTLHLPGPDSTPAEGRAVNWQVATSFDANIPGTDARQRITSCSMRDHYEWLVWAFFHGRRRAAKAGVSDASMIFAAGICSATGIGELVVRGSISIADATRSILLQVGRHTVIEIWPDQACEMRDALGPSAS